MIVVALLSGMSLLLSQALQSTQATDAFFEASSRAAERGQTTIYTVTGLVSESRHLYQNDVTGKDYLDACDLSGLPVAPGSRLPLIADGEELDVDTTGDPRTGNMLLFVREINASSCVGNAKTKSTRWIDTYRMVAVYPHIANRSIAVGEKTARDLVIWRSLAFPSRQQLLEIGDNKERESVIEDLVLRYGFTHAWDPAEPVDGAFFRLKADGKIEDAPEAGFVIEEDDRLSEGGRLVYAGTRLAETSGESKLRSAVLADQGVGAWQPHGFEVKISGHSGSRTVWLHTVVEGPTKDGRRTAVHAHTTMAHVRDF